jgi:hypothetical protein
MLSKGISSMVLRIDPHPVEVVLTSRTGDFLTARAYNSGIRSSAPSQTLKGACCLCLIMSPRPFSTGVRVRRAN